MKPQELFGVMVRVIGLILILEGFGIALGVFSWWMIVLALVHIAAGVAFIWHANFIVRLCYSPSDWFRAARGPGDDNPSLG